MNFLEMLHFSQRYRPTAYSILNGYANNVDLLLYHIDRIKKKKFMIRRIENCEIAVGLIFPLVYEVVNFEFTTKIIPRLVST